MAIVELVPSNIARDVVAAFQHLTEGAVHGHIIGAAYVIFLKGGRRYMTDWCGSVERSPTQAMGAVSVLHGQLEDLVLQKDPEQTR